MWEEEGPGGIRGRDFRGYFCLLWRCRRVG